MNQNIKYTGQVTVTIKQKDKIISKHIYNNHGNYPLFRFLCECIARIDREDKGPYYIRLFKLVSDPKTNDPYSETDIDNLSIPLCSGIGFNARDVEDEDIEDNPAAYIHFTIPYSVINATGADGNVLRIHQAGLYNRSNAASNDIKNYSASFNFIKDDPNVTGSKLWDPITISLTNDDFNIYINWKLSFNN